MAWRAARSLLVLQRQLQVAAPQAAPRGVGAGTLDASAWGLIGDAEHDPTSDHSPHDFPGWGNDIVTAADFPNAPALGLDAHQVLDDIRRSHDPRAKYGISNGKIFSNHDVWQGGVLYDAWSWRPYVTSSGGRPADGHYTHGHLSVVGDRRADGEQPWAINGTAGGGQEDEDDMGASFGPIEIQREGITSLTIPPVQAGLADPRPAWLNLCNATGDEPYRLRIWVSKGAPNVWEPLKGDGWVNGERTMRGGERVGVELGKGTGGLDIRRVPVGAEKAPYAGHLTLAIERGRVTG